MIDRLVCSPFIFFSLSLLPLPLSRSLQLRRIYPHLLCLFSLAVDTCAIMITGHCANNMLYCYHCEQRRVISARISSTWSTTIKTAIKCIARTRASCENVAVSSNDTRKDSIGRRKLSRRKHDHRVLSLPFVASPFSRAIAGASVEWRKNHGDRSDEISPTSSGSTARARIS